MRLNPKSGRRESRSAAVRTTFWSLPMTTDALVIAATPDGSLAAAPLVSEGV